MQISPAVGAYSPWVSHDGLRLYVQAGFSGIIVAHRSDTTSPWGPFENLPGQINDIGEELSPCESPSGDTLYFSYWLRGEPSGFDAYYSVWTDSGWGARVNLGPNVNSAYHEECVRLSLDGSLLLISSGGYLFYHEKLPDGTWGLAIDFGPNINTWEPQLYPSLSPDMDRLFFYREGPNRGDIWESRKVEGLWQPATPLPAPVCSSMTREDSPFMMKDGRTLIFRRGGLGLYFSVDTTVLAVNPVTQPLSSDTKEQLVASDWGSDGIRLKLSAHPGRYPVRVHNLLGRRVYEASIEFSPDGDHSACLLRLTDASAGIYVVSVQVADRQLHTKYVRLP